MAGLLIRPRKAALPAAPALSQTKGHGQPLHESPVQNSWEVRAEREIGHSSKYYFVSNITSRLPLKRYRKLRQRDPEP